MRHLQVVVLVAAASLLAAGCSNKKLVKQQEQQIADLQAEVQDLHTQLDGERARANQLNDELSRSLSDFRKKEQVWMEQQDMMTRITLDGEVSFGSGSANVSAAGQEILDAVWNVLKNYPDRDVLVEGHTDNVQIAEQWRHRFKSNWELSSARAHAVLHFAVKNYGANPSQMAAVGYGEYRPIASNDTEQGRSANRRVVITVGPRAQVKALP